MQALKRLLRKEWVSRLIDGLLPVFATLAALGVGAIILLFLGVNPIEAIQRTGAGRFRQRQCLCRNSGQSHTIAAGCDWYLYLISWRCDQYRWGRPDDHRCATGDLGGTDLYQPSRLGW